MIGAAAALLGLMLALSLSWAISRNVKCCIIMKSIVDSLLRVDRFIRLSMLEAPVPDWLVYSGDQRILFDSPVRHEASFKRRLLDLSPCVDAGLVGFGVHLSRLYMTIARRAATFIYGDMFDVSVSVEGDAVNLSDLTFGWMVDQREEYAVLVLVVALNACIFLGENVNLMIKGPSVLLVMTIFEKYSTGISSTPDGSLRLKMNDITSFLTVHHHSSAFITYPPSVLLSPAWSFFQGGCLNVSDIHSMYLDDLARMLYRLHCRIMEGVNFGLYSQTVSVNVKFSEEGAVCSLTYVEIRPCAQRIGLGRLIIWRVVRSSAARRCKTCVVSCAVAATQTLCKRLGFVIGSQGEDGEADCSISGVDENPMEAPPTCSVDDLILSHNAAHTAEYFELNPVLFPLSTDLNNQVMVNTRGL